MVTLLKQTKKWAAKSNILTPPFAFLYLLLDLCNIAMLNSKQPDAGLKHFRGKKLSSFNVFPLLSILWVDIYKLCLITDLCENIQLLNNVPQGRAHTWWMTRENFQWVCLRHLYFFLSSSFSFFSVSPHFILSSRFCPTCTSTLDPSVQSWIGNMTCWQTVIVVTVSSSRLHGCQAGPTV